MVLLNNCRFKTLLTRPAGRSRGGARQGINDVTRARHRERHVQMSCARIVTIAALRIPTHPWCRTGRTGGRTDRQTDRQTDTHTHTHTHTHILAISLYLYLYLARSLSLSLSLALSLTHTYTHAHTHTHTHTHHINTHPKLFACGKKILGESVWSHFFHELHDSWSRARQIVETPRFPEVRVRTFCSKPHQIQLSGFRHLFTAVEAGKYMESHCFNVRAEKSKHTIPKSHSHPRV